MASNQKEKITETNLKKVVTCPACQGYFKQPKQLPNCPHSLCLECLRKFEDKKTINEDGSCVKHDEQNCEECLGFECPVCCVFIYIGPEGIDAFPLNSIAQQIADMLEEQENQTVLAESCVEAKEVCPHCNSKLCNSCRMAHMESLKTEIAKLHQTWVQQFPRARRPHSKLESVLENAKGTSAEQLNFLENKLETVVQTLQASASATLNEKAEQIINQAKAAHDGKLEQLRQALDIIGGEDIAETQRLDSFLQQSVLKSRLSEAAALHKIVSDADKELREAQSLSSQLKLDVEIDDNIDAALADKISTANLGILQHHFIFDD